MLWDHAGSLWSDIRSLFKDFKHRQVTPNEVFFHADGRFDIVVALERFAITDYDPKGSIDRTAEVASQVYRCVTRHLGLRVFTRIGTRMYYVLEFKTPEEARRKAREFGLTYVPPVPLFGVVPGSVSPTFKVDVDDGEIGYTAQLYTVERKMDFNPPPEFANSPIKRIEDTRHELMLDVDFFTKKPIGVESFEMTEWLAGWNRAANSDMNKLLNQVRAP